MQTFDTAPTRWRFLGSSIPPWVLLGALLVVLLWLGGVAWLLFEVIHGITGVPGRMCP